MTTTTKAARASSRMSRDDSMGVLLWWVVLQPVVVVNEAPEMPVYVRLPAAVTPRPFDRGRFPRCHDAGVDRVGCPALVAAQAEDARWVYLHGDALPPLAEDRETTTKPEINPADNPLPQLTARRFQQE